MNDARTNALSCAETVPGKSPHCYELIDRFGMRRGFFESAVAAAEAAQRIWLDQEQDEERSGRGWDIQTVGADR